MEIVRFFHPTEEFQRQVQTTFEKESHRIACLIPEAEAEKADALLKTLLPMSFRGVNAVGRVGVLSESRAKRLRADLEQRGTVTVLAHPVLTTVSGRPASIQMGTIIRSGERENGPVEAKPVGYRIDVVPILLGNGNWRLEMRSETKGAGNPHVKEDGRTTPAAVIRWVDGASELKPGQTMVTAMLEPKAGNSGPRDNQLKCTLFVPTPSLANSPAADVASSVTPPFVRKAQAKPRSVQVLTR